ncbi:cobaltochelatase subunit CobN [Thiohalophilus sp.]|uniref:cobaltochelatase subunit CobN n=1 Tax=Thiohalophilus sp. TaxID=3028392 RepID=UPI002ACE8A49|nr:cobaltochelatase subunit CobN [Thiohalophilus sp.]MDZ7803021.1 cobaltochelatase subunit CobN [Thiohalophilus sp.]
MNAHIIRILQVLLLCAGLFASGTASSATLFGIVSERSAQDLVAGARQFAESHPGHTLKLRTPSQIAAYSDKQLVEQLQQADAILIAAIFSEPVPRLQRLLGETALAKDIPLFITHSDRRLIRLSRLGGKRVLQDLDDKQLNAINENPAHDEAYRAHLANLIDAYPAQQRWLELRAYWQNRGSDNVAGLIASLLQKADPAISVPPLNPQAAVRYYNDERMTSADKLELDPDKPLIAILDYHTGDRAGDIDLLEMLCERLEQRRFQCLGILARWGQASVQALRQLSQGIPGGKPVAIINLQDFAVGGGEHRREATRLLEQIDVPVLKGIRLAERTADQWQLSEDGVPWNDVHYKVAMPEIQGSSQPLVLATRREPFIDPLTGLEIAPLEPASRQVDRIVARLANWHRLQRKPNSEKRIAVIYYNHPPGRHNVGADNLDVPASLWDLLQHLKKAGYRTGPLPKDPEALLERIQDQGLNLPEDHAALSQMASKTSRLSLADYQDWFDTLPEAVRDEVSHGPLAYLTAMLKQARERQQPRIGKALLERTINDIRHLLESVDHPARQRALDLLEQLQTAHRASLAGEDRNDAIRRLNRALRNTGIEGLRGWGEPPGKVMVHDNHFLLPGIRFGNVFIGPQPPRGWEVNEELLHANLAFPPPHQYLAFYRWLQNEFKADALVHLGRHSTYEFLPRRRVGLTGEDYPTLMAGDLPGVYPYIVDGVGEGIQAKRRGLAVIVDHLTPPLKTTPLYDDLLQLRQLVESFEASRDNSPTRTQAVERIRALIDELNLREELEAVMQDELAVRQLDFEQVDDDLLVHEVGHYLTEMQERFMPLGLHVFGRDWDSEAVDTMLASMMDQSGTQRSEESRSGAGIRAALESSPAQEIRALLAGLDGRFVKPGKGNDPIRTPEALPTGRNFHALDGSVLPTRIGYDLGVQLAREARQQNDDEAPGSEALVLWASDTVRDEGAMVAFGMDMLGIKPIWNSRGIFKGIERLELKAGRQRHDMVFTTSGLFRDLYGNLLVWLDKAVLLALDGASETIRREHPQLAEALQHALAPLGDERDPGNESLAQNHVAANWVQQAQALINKNKNAALAGRLASLRLFGDAPGSYGAGVNRLAERSGAWSDRRQLSQTYIHRMGHAYGADLDGLPAHDSFRASLGKVRHTYLGRASNLYGLMDNNDAFDYLGGLSMAVEHTAGAAPDNHVIQHADPNNAGIQPLDSALLQELRGRFLNPVWLKALMQHDYAGARTMGSEFMEYLWGWQVTNPEIIKSWVWDEVKEVYIDDRHQLGLDEFLEQGRNVHVKTNMLAIMLVAAHKEFWEVDAQTRQELARAFAQLVNRHGLPGSGHTRPDHPMLQGIKPLLDEPTRRTFENVLAAAAGPQQPAKPDTVTTTISEIKPESSTTQTESPASESEAKPSEPHEPGKEKWLILAIALLIITGGALYERYLSGRRLTTNRGR